MRKCRCCTTGYMVEVYYDAPLVVQGVQLVAEGLMCLRCNNCGAEIETANHVDYNGSLVQHLVEMWRDVDEDNK